MHSISLVALGLLLATVCCCPFAAHATTTETIELEEPKILPLTDALKTSSANEEEAKSPFKREVWQEDDREVLIRSERGTKDNGSGAAASDSCRYTKGAWTECDPKTNTRSRTLTLKKGEGSCVQTRTIQKKCKKGKSEKACRYDKGTWGECQPNGEMTRLDKLKSTSDSATCAPTRTMNKKCNKSKQEKQMKNRNAKEKKQNDRKNRQ